MTDRPQSCPRGKRSIFISADLTASAENNPSRVPAKRTRLRDRRTSSTTFDLIKHFSFAALFFFSTLFVFQSNQIETCHWSDGPHRIYDLTPKHKLTLGAVSDPSLQHGLCLFMYLLLYSYNVLLLLFFTGDREKRGP